MRSKTWMYLFKPFLTFSTGHETEAKNKHTHYRPRARLSCKKSKRSNRRFLEWNLGASWKGHKPKLLKSCQIWSFLISFGRNLSKQYSDRDLNLLCIDCNGVFFFLQCLPFFQNQPHFQSLLRRYVVKGSQKLERPINLNLEVC